MIKLPKNLTDTEAEYLTSLDVAAMNPGDPPQRLLDIASRYIKWGLHTPNVKTGLLGVTESEDGYAVFIRVLLLNVQWTVVKNGYDTREEALGAWFDIARGLGAPEAILAKQYRFAAGVFGVAA